MRALVTGAAGFIGSHLTEKLLDQGQAVVAVDSFAPTYDTGVRRESMERIRSKSPLQVIEGDLLQMELSEIIADVDVVFHLAARPGVRASWEDFDKFTTTNIGATKRLLAAVARASNAPKLVFASSSSVYGNTSKYPTPETATLTPISPYGVTKAAAEHLVEAYISQMGIDAVTLRYFTVYGPRQRPDMAFHRWMRAALTDQEILVFGDGSAIRDFTYIADVVEATLSALDLPAGTAANVAGGSPASLTAVLDEISRLAGRRLRIRHERRQRGDPLRTGGDTRLLTQKTGWAPETDLGHGLEAQYRWMKGLLGM